MIRTASLFLMMSALLPGLPAAREQAPAARQVVEIPRLGSPPRLEAFLDMRPEGAVEAGMARVEGLVQQTPEDGRPATQRTRIYLGYDDDAIYAVFVAFDDETDKIRSNLSRREDVFGDETVEIMLDTFHDERRAYAFLTNPLGIQWDAIWTEGRGFDSSFDTVWHSKGRLTERGYVVWMAIPFKSLRFPASPSQEWGVLFVRDIPRNNETSFWPPVSARVEGRLNQAATLRGLEEISPGKNMQFIPYATASSLRVNDSEPSDGDLRDGDDLDAGLDAKFVFNDALVLDVTANPDFSEVESDSPQVTVNERFEVFFPEKRPFFLENANFFQTPINLLFTRRVSDPRAGLRMTGKVGAYNIGALVIDDEAPGKRAEPGDPLHGERALTGVVRVSRDILKQSSVGFTFTDRELGDGHNRVGGVDGRFKLNDNWTSTVQAVTSGTRLEDGTELDGPAYDLVFNRNARKFTTHIHYLDFSPGFATQSGFVPRTDIREFHQSVGYRFWPEGERLISWGPELFWAEVRDHEGTRLDWSVQPLLSWELRRQTEFGVFHREAGERLRPSDLPDSDPDSDPEERSLDFNQHTTGVFFSTRFTSSLSAEIDYVTGTAVNFLPPDDELPFKADIDRVDLGLTLRPTSRLRIENEYLLTRLSDPGGGSRVFRNRIVRSRFSYQFTRRLTLRSILRYDATRGNPERSRVATERNFNGDLLVTYLVNPWTALFVGYNGNDYEDLTGDDPDLVRTSPYRHDARQLFVKFSYLLRP